jgi:crotonobetainyl-CoA:carnitine CoA-transferase CaiB-like acyl-CoA transferase
VGDERPLAGLRVVDQADDRGALCGRLLADLGADVVRVEPPGGAPTRALGPFVDGESLHHAVRNVSKTGCTIDPSSRDGRADLLDLLARADVWIETSPPGSHAASAFAPEVIAARYPRLIVTSITDFGRTGPYRDFAATDPTLAGLGWVLRRSGSVAEPPAIPPASFTRDIAAVTAAFATVTAVLHRLRTGEGQVLDVSVLEAAAATTDWSLATYSVLGPKGMYPEVRDGSGQVNPLLPCADGWLRLCINTQAEWGRILTWMQEPVELLDHAFESAIGRAPRWDDLIAPALVAHLADQSMVAACDEAQKHRVPLTPLLGPRAVLTAPHYATRGAFVDTEVAAGRVARIPSGFWTIDGARPGVQGPAPALADAVPAVSLWRDARPDEATAAAPGLGPDGGAPFRGLLVLDFGVAGASPELGRTLAEYGAEVVRIEDPEHPEVFRMMGGPSGIGPMFASSNRSKRSLGLRLTTPEAVDLIRRLARHADVAIENLAPGVLDRLGIGFDVLRQDNPALVTWSSQMMGAGAEWSDWRGYGVNAQAISGFSGLWAVPGVPEPAQTTGAFPDHVTGRLGALVVAAMLVRRATSGRGGHIEMAQVEVSLGFLAELFAKEWLEPGSVRPPATDAERLAPWGVYRCAGDDRWCVITCRSDDDWDGLARAMGEPERSRDPRFATNAGRLAHREELDRRLADWTATITDRAVMERLQQFGVPAGFMMYIRDIPDDPHFAARGYPRHLDQPGVGPVILEGPGFHGSTITDAITTPAPFLGQHSRRILVERLGLDDATVDELVRTGVVVESAWGTG